jgi:hypothetical protein
MLKKDDEDNSIASDNDTNEVVVKDDDDDDEDEDDEEECEDKDEEDEDEDEEEEEEEEEEEDEDNDQDDDANEYDDNVIKFELYKNFFVDDEGNTVANNLKSIAHELRTLNKIARVLISDKKKSDKDS